VPPVFTDPKQSSPNYWLLFITITAAVVVGNLASSWITAKVAQYQIELSWGETVKAIDQETRRIQAVGQEAVQRSREQTTRKMEQLRAQRSVDVNGKMLAKQCDDWQRANLELKSATAQAETRKYCSNYEHYINTGELRR
jgi:hypothetical protein